MGLYRQIFCAHGKEVLNAVKSKEICVYGCKGETLIFKKTIVFDIMVL